MGPRQRFGSLVAGWRGLAAFWLMILLVLAGGGVTLRLENWAMLSRTLLRATNRSFHPSLSKSKIPFPHPDIVRVTANWVGSVCSTNWPPPTL